MQTSDLQFTTTEPCTQEQVFQPLNIINDVRGIRTEKKAKMARYRNTDINGNQWPEKIVKAVWNKGQIIPGFDPDKYRKDSCGAWMQYDKFGFVSENGVGWEIDHIKPVSKGGTDDMSNLQPLQWQNNRSKAEEFPAVDYAIIGSF
jgi:hypothetical protein